VVCQAHQTRVSVPIAPTEQSKRHGARTFARKSDLASTIPSYLTFVIEFSMADHFRRNFLRHPL